MAEETNRELRLADSQRTVQVIRSGPLGPEIIGVERHFSTCPMLPADLTNLAERAYTGQCPLSSACVRRPFAGNHDIGVTCFNMEGTRISVISAAGL